MLISIRGRLITRFLCKCMKMSAFYVMQFCTDSCYEDSFLPRTQIFHHSGYCTLSLEIFEKGLQIKQALIQYLQHYVENRTRPKILPTAFQKLFVGTERNILNKNFESPVHIAVRTGDALMLELLIKEGKSKTNSAAMQTMLQYL